MLFLSNLPNDQDLIKALGSIAIPCALFTDCAFWGKSPNSINTNIGIERKKIGDLVSCILDGRLLYQAQIAKENNIDIFIVIVEGRIRPNPDDGLLEIPCWGINPRTMHRAEIWTPVKPAMTYSRFDQYLTELHRDAGIMVKRTEDVKETAAVIKALWDNYQRTDHQSLKQMFKPPTPTVQLVRPSLIRRIASEFPSVGWERSGAIAQYFQSVSEMVNADVSEWENIMTIDSNGKTRRIGHKTAENIIIAIRNGGTIHNG